MSSLQDKIMNMFHKTNTNLNFFLNTRLARLSFNVCIYNCICPMQRDTYIYYLTSHNYYVYSIYTYTFM